MTNICKQYFRFKVMILKSSVFIKAHVLLCQLINYLLSSLLNIATDFLQFPCVIYESFVSFLKYLGTMQTISERHSFYFLKLRNGLQIEGSLETLYRLNQ